MSINDMMNEHVIVDIDDYVHVVDGKVIYYEPDTIDFEDEEQVENFFGMVEDLFVHELYPERYGHGNTMLVITGDKDCADKYLSMNGMHHFPPELKEKVNQAVLEYENQLKNEHIRDMMKQHVIVDIDDDIHVVDGKVIDYEPDTIDFDDENQVHDFFDMVSKVFVHELLPERYGKGNTCVVITGTKSDRNKIISMQGMHHFPSEIMEKVQQAVLEYENQLKNERIRDMMKQHVIVDIDDYVHVIDGKVICYEPDTIDFESEEQVKNLLDIATNLYKNGFYTEEYGTGNTRFVISGSKEYVEKYGNIDDMTHFSSELMEKVRKAVNEYKNRSSNRI